MTSRESAAKRAQRNRTSARNGNRTSARSKNTPAGNAARRLRSHAMDYSILFLVLVLVGFGLVMIYSTSSYRGSLYMDDAAYWLKRQALFALVGVAAMLIFARIDYHVWKARSWFIYIYYAFIALLLAYTIVFAGVSHGSRRWITIGPIQFQPSEVAKVVLILILAIYISSHKKQLQTNRGLLFCFLITIPILALVGIANLSTCIILMAIVAVMIFVSTKKRVVFGAIAAIAVVGAAILLGTQSYRMDRIATFFNPESSDTGMQTMQSLYAIGSGGLFGKGLGQSMQKMGFVPESHNDMIFSIICEELGLFGAIAVIALYGILIWRFLVVAINAADTYGSIMVVGVIAHIGIQVFVNIGVVTNTIPNTGVPLPFISYGGTSMIFLLVEMGLVLSVSRYVRLKE